MLGGRKVAMGHDGFASKTSEVLHIYRFPAFLYDSPGAAEEAVSDSFASFANNPHAGDVLPAQPGQLPITPPHS